MKHKLLCLWHRSLRYAGPYGIAGVTLLMGAVLTASSIPHVQQQGREIRMKVAPHSNNLPGSVALAVY